MSQHSWNVQQAVFAALDGKITVETAAAAVAIHDSVPDAAASAAAPDSAFPYVQVGEADAIADDVSALAGGDDGEDETLTLHVWSRYPGQKEIKLIMEAAKALLHQKPLNVAGRASALAFVRARRAFLDPDGKTRHGVLSVEVYHRN